MKDMAAVVMWGGGWGLGRCVERLGKWVERLGECVERVFWGGQSQCHGGFGGAIGASSADGVGGDGCHPSGMYSFSSTQVARPSWLY